MTMRRVPGPDATFLAGERPEWHMHVSALIRLSPSESFDLDALRSRLEHRIHQLPQFRWKLLDPAAGVVRTYWIDDDRFDLDRHLFHVALPAPGDEHALGRLVGRLVSTKLDRTRPLWEMWLIDGLADGGSAILAKVHHSIVDGESGFELATLLFDLEADPDPDPPPPPWEPEPAPGSGEVFRQSLAGAAEWPIRAGRLAVQWAGQATTYLTHAVSSSGAVMPFAAPRTSFNGRLTPGRSFAAASLSLDEVKAVKDALDVKLNDVVMAVVGGALRSYLDARDEELDAPLIAQVPTSMRRDGAHADAIGTKVSMMFASMASDVDDPVERVRAVHESTTAAKQLRGDLSEHQLAAVTETMAPAAIALAARAWTTSGLDGATRPVFNVIVSNVAGPPFDLYIAGARVDAMYPMGPLLLGGGVNVTVVSVGDRLHVGLLSCPDLLDDGWELAALVESTMADLLTAVGDTTGT